MPFGYTRPSDHVTETYAHRVTPETTGPFAFDENSPIRSGDRCLSRTRGPVDGQGDHTERRRRPATTVGAAGAAPVLRSRRARCGLAPDVSARRPRPHGPREVRQSP